MLFKKAIERLGDEAFEADGRRFEVLARAANGAWLFGCVDPGVDDEVRGVWRVGLADLEEGELFASYILEERPEAVVLCDQGDALVTYRRGTLAGLFGSRGHRLWGATLEAKAKAGLSRDGELAFITEPEAHASRLLEGRSGRLLARVPSTRLAFDSEGRVCVALSPRAGLGGPPRLFPLEEGYGIPEAYFEALKANQGGAPFRSVGGPEGHLPQVDPDRGWAAYQLEDSRWLGCPKCGHDRFFRRMLGQRLTVDGKKKHRVEEERYVCARCAYMESYARGDWYVD